MNAEGKQIWAALCKAGNEQRKKKAAWAPIPVGAIEGDFFTKLARLTGRNDYEINNFEGHGSGYVQRMTVFSHFPPDLSKRLGKYFNPYRGKDPEIEAEAEAFLNVLRKAFPKASLEMDEDAIFIFLG